MYAILGDYKFQDYKGFQELEITDSLAISEHAVIEGKPRLQATGQDLRKISLKYLLHSSFSNPESDIEFLRRYQRSAQVLPFLSGNGNSFGNFVIEQIKTAAIQTDKSGGQISIEVEIVLLEAVVVDTDKKAQDKLAVRPSNIIIKALPPVKTDPQKISLNLRNINTQTSAIAKELSNAAKIASAVDRAFRSSKRRIDSMRVALVNIEKVGNQTQKIAGSYNSMKGQAAQVSNSVESLSTFVNAGDLNSSINASGQLSNSVGKLNADSATLNNLVSIRRSSDISSL